MKYKNTGYGLLVSNLEKEIFFYQNILGYTLVRKNPGFALFDTDTSILYLWQWSHMCEHLGQEAMSKVKHRCQLCIKFDTQEEVDAAYSELVSKEVEFVVKPTEWPLWGSYAGYFIDPEGYMWEIFCWIKDEAIVY